MERYASSTFNISPHRPLQEMDGPLLENHIKSNVKPRVCHTPSQILIHWQNKVEDTRRDEALEFLQKYPMVYRLPGVTEWWTPTIGKQDESPKQTVELIS